MSTNQTKVYCGQCRWFKYHMSHTSPSGLTHTPGREDCRHISNIKWVDTHRGRHKDKAWTPAEKNANNDCPLHEPIPPKQGLMARLVASLTYTRLDRPRGHE